MKWMVPVNSLDAVQLRTIDAIVKNPKQNHWVKGFAGSGKTIVLTHVLERLATSRPPLRICFATFTHALKDLVESGLSQTALNRVDISTFDSIGKLRGQYDVLVADEMQDIPSRRLTKVKAKASTLVIAADLDQSIYRSACKVPELNLTIKPAKEHQLQDIHRMNENVFQIATAIYDDAFVAPQAMVRHDDEVTRLYVGSSQRDEFVTMFDEAVRLAAIESPSAILFPDKALLDRFVSTISSAKSYSGIAPSVKDVEQREEGEGPDPFRLVNEFLRKNKSPLQVFGSGSGSLYDSDTKKVVYLMTYHSAKGLDFANVFLPNLTAETGLSAMKHAPDLEERRMFFVAATRARERLHLSHHDEPHRFLREIPDDYLQSFTRRKRSY